MILIADSGSTKTHWCLLRDSQVVGEYFTKGINPFYQNQVEIEQAIVEELLPNVDPLAVAEIYFYGAGCANAEKNAVIEQALSTCFVHAKTAVASDLLGACKGLLGNTPGIGCILGTGSNSCYYNGEEIISNVSPLGFILGDEGSGANLGKLLVADMLKNQFPAELKELFLQEAQVTPAEIIDRVYRQPFPNRFLASLSRFLINHIDQKPCYDLVFYSFSQFFERNLMQYTHAREYPVSFVGSIAYYYRDVLEKVAEKYGMQIGNILQSPMDGLVLYHKKK